MKALEAVIDPELRRSIVELGMVRQIDISDQRSGRRDRVPDDRRLPDQGPLPDLGRRGCRGLGGRHARERVLRCPQRHREGVPPAEAGARRPPAGRARSGQQRDVHRLGQGRRGQVHSHRQPRRGLDRGRQEGGHPRRRRVGLLDPAHVRPRRDAPAGLRPAQDRALGVPWREGHVDRFLP